MSTYQLSERAPPRKRPQSSRPGTAKTTNSYSAVRGGNQTDIRRARAEMRSLLVCLVDQNAKPARLLATAIAACKEMGINPDDLGEKHVNDFYPNDIEENAQEFAQLRHQNYEKRRRKKIMLVVEFMREAGEDVRGPFRNNFATQVKTSLSHVIKSSMRRPHSAHPRSLLKVNEAPQQPQTDNLSQFRSMGGNKTSATPTVETAVLNEQNRARMADAQTKEHEKLSRLQVVNQNLLNNCRYDVDTIDKIKKRTLNQQQAAYAQQRDAKFLDVPKKNLTIKRRNDAKTYLREKETVRARNSMRYYQTYRKEATDRKQSGAAHDRNVSAADFAATLHDFRKSSMPESALWNTATKQGSPVNAGKGPFSQEDGSPKNKSTIGKFPVTEKQADRKKPMAGEGDEVNSEAGTNALNASIANRGTSVVGGMIGENCMHLDLSRAASKGNRPQSAMPVPTRHRNQTAYRLHLTHDEKVKNTKASENEIASQLANFEDRQNRALEVQNLTLLSKQIKGTQFLQNHERTVERKLVIKEKHELGTLNNYVMAGKRLNDNLNEINTNKGWQRQVIREKYEARKELVRKNKAENKRREEIRRRGLLKRLEKADIVVAEHKNKIDSNVGLRKELELLKQAETNENAEIARAVRVFQKRQLIDKQLEVNKQQSIFKEHQVNLAKQIFQNDRERQHMMNDRHQQVKYIKENYLNQMEAQESKRMAQMAKQAAADAAEAADWTLAEDGGAN